jgi:hypothetical protein
MTNETQHCKLSFNNCLHNTPMVSADVSLQIQNLCTEKDQPAKIFSKAPTGTNIVRALYISM